MSESEPRWLEVTCPYCRHIFEIKNLTNPKLVSYEVIEGIIIHLKFKCSNCGAKFEYKTKWDRYGL